MFMPNFFSSIVAVLQRLPEQLLAGKKSIAFWLVSQEVALLSPTTRRTRRILNTNNEHNQKQGHNWNIQETKTLLQFQIKHVFL